MSDVRKQILIVEDDVNINNMIKEVLIKEGYKASQAFHGLEGVEKFKQATYNMVILDIMMPVMDGITLCHKLKTTISTSHIPIILLTAKGQEVEKEEGFAMGADFYMTKPFRPKEIVAKARSLFKL